MSDSVESTALLAALEAVRAQMAQLCDRFDELRIDMKQLHSDLKDSHNGLEIRVRALETSAASTNAKLMVVWAVLGSIGIGLGGIALKILFRGVAQ